LNSKELKFNRLTLLHICLTVLSLIFFHDCVNSPIDLSPEPIRPLGFELINFKVKHRFDKNYKKSLNSLSWIELYCLECYEWHRVERSWSLDMNDDDWLYRVK